jgi:hypothetical protein
MVLARRRIRRHGDQMMRAGMQGISAGLLFLAFMLVGTPLARAQTDMSSAGRSLGGYGAATIGRYYGSGMGTYMPYNGNASGFISYQGGYAGGLGAQPISRRLPQTPIGGVSMPMTSIGGTSLTSQMSAGMRGRMGAGLARGVFAPFGYEGGIGMGMGAIGTPMTRQAGMRRTRSGPGFGYPFQMPADLSGAPGGMGVMAP